MSRLHTPVTLALIALTIVGCAGRTPVPVMAAQYGDENKSCQTLAYEMNHAQSEMTRLLPKADKTGQNVALGIAGAFFLVPWFFMDFKEAEQTEYEAYRQRYNHLGMIAMQKNCGIQAQQFLSVDEMKRQNEQYNKQNPGAYN